MKGPGSREIPLQKLHDRPQFEDIRPTSEFLGLREREVRIGEAPVRNGLASDHDVRFTTHFHLKEQCEIGLAPSAAWAEII